MHVILRYSLVFGENSNSELALKADMVLEMPYIGVPLAVTYIYCDGLKLRAVLGEEGF